MVGTGDVRSLVVAERLRLEALWLARDVVDADFKLARGSGVEVVPRDRPLRRADEFVVLVVEADRDPDRLRLEVEALVTFPVTL